MAVPSLQSWQSYTGQRIHCAQRLLKMAADSSVVSDSAMLERAALSMLEQAWKGLLQSLARQQGLSLNEPTVAALEAAIGYETAETGLLRGLLKAPHGWLSALLDRFKLDAQPQQAASVVEDDDELAGKVAPARIPSITEETEEWTVSIWSRKMRELVTQIQSSSLEC